jgi:hypothetical protein
LLDPMGDEMRIQSLMPTLVGCLITVNLSLALVLADKHALPIRYYIDHGITTSYDPTVTGRNMRAAEPAAAADVLEAPHAELALDHLRRIFPTDTVGRLELADAGPAHTLVSLAGVQVERALVRIRQIFQAGTMGGLELAAVEPALLGPDLLIEVPDVPGDLTAVIAASPEVRIASADPLAPENFLDSNPDELNRLIAANLMAAGDFATGSITSEPRPASLRGVLTETSAPVAVPDPSLDIVLPASL